MTEIIVDLRIINKEGSIRAFADITFPTDIGEITGKGFKVFEKDGNAPWVAFPSSRNQKDGKYVYYPIIETSKLTKKRLTEMVLKEYQKKVNNNSDGVF